MKKIIISLLLICPVMLMGQKTILINNVEIFNGTDEKTTTGNVLIENNLITKISTGPIMTNKSGMTKIIDGKGKFLMPGLIDAHAHTTMDAMPINLAMVSDISYISLFASNSAEKQLMRGFTTVRDVGGNPFSLKKTIDQGLTKGPRIYPSGAMISQTGGHGDFRLPNDAPRHSCGALTYMEANGMAMVADGYDEVLLRTREQLRAGASQIKLAAGGGVASDYDPLDVAQYTKNEFKAAVDATDNWGIYVTVHAYTSKAITTAIEVGVKCIEHEINIIDLDLMYNQ